MLLTIERAHAALPVFWLILAGNTSIALALFLFPLFDGYISTYYMLIAVGVAGGVGLLLGIYLTFRSPFGSVYGLGVLIYAVGLFEIMVGGGAVALATQLLDRPDLRWFAFFTNVVCVMLGLLAGMYREGKALGSPGGTGGWREKLEHYIDYARHQVSPALTTGVIEKKGTVQSMLWIVAVGVANIPLLFEVYGGGKTHVIFLAAPLLMGTFAYVNFRFFGRGLVRLFLLRKLEKAAGRRFVNADIEQIQEIRRGFFLARWLMKDYVAVQSGSTVLLTATRRERSR